MRTCLPVTVLVSCFALFGCANAPSRNLQSITLTPAATQATGGTVQFVATDHWSASPTDTAPVAPTWGACQDGAPPKDVTVSATGLATCGSGAKGTYEIFVEDPKAYTGPVCNVINACGQGCQISGSAQLTCQ